MELYKVRDIVRSNMGKETLEEHYIDWALDAGLRELEGLQNWYWMQTNKDWTLVASQQEYNITTSASSGLNIPNWKDGRILFTRLDSSSRWVEVYGPEDQEDIEQIYIPADTGMPRFYSVHETSTGAPTIKVWPPVPDDTYGMRWYYYTWTSLPTDTTVDTHEVLLRWPEALIALATYAGVKSITKDAQYASSWKDDFLNPRDGLYTRMKRYNLDRQNASRFDLAPRQGPLISRLYREGLERYR